MSIDEISRDRWVSLLEAEEAVGDAYAASASAARIVGLFTGCRCHADNILYYTESGLRIDYDEFATRQAKELLLVGGLNPLLSALQRGFDESARDAVLERVKEAIAMIDGDE